jgi:hypothetical protein
MSVSKTLEEIEAVGIEFRLDGQRVRIRYPNAGQRRELAEQISFLRSHKDEVVELLRQRTTIPPMPAGVRLVEWNLKGPPVGIETSTVVIDPALFARTTLAQLGTALSNPGRWVGWSVPQLIDRLAQVGVIVAIESASGSELPMQR